MIAILSKFFQKIDKKEIFPNSVNQSGMTLILKLVKYITRILQNHDFHNTYNT